MGKGRVRVCSFILFAILVVILIAFVIARRCSSAEGKVQNKYLYQWSTANLEIVAKNSKMQSQKDDALLILFERYKNGNVITLYDYYLNHKGEKYTDEALAIVTFKCDSLYKIANKTNTEQGWSDYLVNVPQDFLRDATDRYNEFKWAHTADKWDTDEKAWEQVQLLKGTEAYKRYQKLYPTGFHATEAHQVLQRKERDEKIRERNREIYLKKYKLWLEQHGKGHYYYDE